MKVRRRLATATLVAMVLNTGLGVGAEGPSSGQGQAKEGSSDVEQLKQQNTELLRRLDKLATELGQIKAQLADKPETDSSRAKKSATSSLDVEIYGYVKLDAAYDDSRVSVGNYARWVESEEFNPNDNEFNMTANETRVGLRLHGPSTDFFRTSGQVEIDFYGGGSENSPFPRLRQANVTFESPWLGTSLLAGQANDVISPLWMPRVNFSPGWWQGNIGFRRPQLRLTQNISLAE